MIHDKPSHLISSLVSSIMPFMKHDQQGFGPKHFNNILVLYLM
jgi:hypothetical protein